MSETAGIPTVHYPIDIPAKFIRQAMEHIERTGARYVTMMFSGELIGDAVCTGISTRLMIADQRPKVAQPPEPAATAIPRARPAKWTVKTITDEVILGVIRENPVPLSTKQIGDTLGIPGQDVAVRQRVRRVLGSLLQSGVIRKTGHERYSSFELVGEMPLRQGHRPITRRQITTSMVLQEIQKAERISSKSISDNLGIPRSDNNVRQKVTQCVRELIMAGHVRLCDQLDPSGGRLYEAIQQTDETENSVDMQV